jgi:hypothetical protein
MPTMRPQSAVPHCVISTTPWPFSVTQLPIGLSVGTASAAEAVSPIASATIRHKNAVTFVPLRIACLKILPRNAILCASASLQPLVLAKDLPAERMYRGSAGVGVAGKASGLAREVTRKSAAAGASRGGARSSSGVKSLASSVPATGFARFAVRHAFVRFTVWGPGSRTDGAWPSLRVLTLVCRLVVDSCRRQEATDAAYISLYLV